VTATPGLVIGVVTADCGPILFSDPKAGVVGAAHAGWKGAMDGVLENTIIAMEKLGARRADIRAVLGPSISQRNYEVGEEYVANFVTRDPDFWRFFAESQRPDHSMFDLRAFTLHRLEAAGVECAMTDDCTYADEKNFYSYRRATHRSEADYGRQLSAISIRSA
jgi:polyphenol oxidase